MKSTVTRRADARSDDTLHALRVNPEWAKLPLFDRSQWQRVRFGDVVRVMKEQIDPSSGEVERYVAGEHMESENVHIRQWGTVGDGYLGPAFIRRFRKGQVLYGSRRTYLKKVALAEWDGVTSNTTLVLEADEKRLLQRLLPWLMLSERFTKHSVQESKGSTNPYINWPDIAKFEFDLPPLAQQRRIAEILWAIDKVATQWADAAQHSRANLKQRLDTIFQASRDLKFVTLDDLTTKIVDGVHKTPDYTSTGIPFIVVENLTRGHGIDFLNTRFVSESDHKKYFQRANPERGDVLVSKDGTLGVTRYIDTDRDFSIFVSVALLKPKRDALDGEFLAYYMHSELFWSHVRKTSAGSALKHIVLRDFKSAPFPIVPLDKQREHVKTLAQIADVTDAADAHVMQSKTLLQAVISELVHP
jgi:type I restriction enzyme, S subunit